MPSLCMNSTAISASGRSFSTSRAPYMPSYPRGSCMSICRRLSKFSLHSRTRQSLSPHKKDYTLYTAPDIAPLVQYGGALYLRVAADHDPHRLPASVHLHRVNDGRRESLGRPFQTRLFDRRTGRLERRVSIRYKEHRERLYEEAHHC